ncbi:MAG TPA: hypothetical protein VGP93_00170 [Polyangiaceae bacterium]|nr:hypothetical protein [Polyangiaceae bacterium]
MRAAALALLLLLVPATASADLGGDVERLTLAWSAFGPVKRLPPRLLERGDVLPLMLPAEATDPTTRGCVTVALLAPASINFVLDLFGPGGDRDAPESSLAGFVQLTRCGAGKAALDRVAIEMRSPRGLIEMLVVSSEVELPPLVQVLPHRYPGPIAPLAGSGPRPSPAPLPLRLRAIEEHSARENAVEFTSEELTASAHGMGEQLLALGPGCYELDLLADDAASSKFPRAVDLDLEVASAQTGEVLASDRSESVDATVSLCTGRPVPISLRFGGALPRGHIRLLRTRWDLERRLPSDWDPDARAQFSAVLRKFRVGLEHAGLVDVSLGVQGSTSIPFEPEAGACYTVAAVRLRGELQGLQLAASVGASYAQNRASPELPGTALAFCAGSGEPGLVEIDSRGLGLVWMTAIWQTGRIVLGADGS